MSILRTLRISAAAGMAGGLMLGSAFAADNPATLRFSHNVTANHPVHAKLLKPWADSIEKASEGSIKFEFFPNEQLGPAKEQYNMARDGIADVTWYLVGIEPGRFPIVTGVEVPFLVKDNAKGSRAIDEWYRKYVDKEMNDVKMCMLFYDGGGTIHANKKIMQPSDLKGMKVRSPNATAARLYRAAGASTIQVSAAEAAQALERGVADALSFPWNLLIHLGIDRVVNKHMDINFYSLGTAILINKGAYAKLSDAQKKVVDNHCTSEWAEKMPPAWVAWELEGREKLIADPKHDVYQISGEDLAKWQALKESAFAQWKKDVKDRGYDPDAVLAELSAKIKEYGAGY